MFPTLITFVIFDFSILSNSLKTTSDNLFSPTQPILPPNFALSELLKYLLYYQIHFYLCSNLFPKYWF